MVICLERGADLHMAQLMPLPLTVSCFSNIQNGFTFLVPAHPGSPGLRAVKRCVSPYLKIPEMQQYECITLPAKRRYGAGCSPRQRTDISPGRTAVHCRLHQPR